MNKSKKTILVINIFLLSFHALPVHGAIQEEMQFSNIVSFSNEKNDFEVNNEYITRGEAADFIYETGYLGYLPYSINPFSDLSLRNTNKKSHYNSILALYKGGIYEGVVGSDKNRLALPYEFITREQAACLLVRAFELKKGDKSIEFLDGTEISTYAKEAVHICSSLNILSGYIDGNFKPQQLITTQEFVTTLYNVIHLLPENAKRMTPLKSTFTPDYLSKDVTITPVSSEISLETPFEIVFENISDNEYAYGIEDYQLEKKIDEEWIVVTNLGYFSNLSLRGIKPHSSSPTETIAINQDKYETLTPGTYRIVFSLFQSDKQMLEYITDKSFCSFEFAIK